MSLLTPTLLCPHISPHTIFLPPPTPLSASDGRTIHYHILFLPGNPGYISYYRSFLTFLHDDLTTFFRRSHTNNRVSVVGPSLWGFVDDSPLGKGVWSLQEQISLAKGALERYLEAVREQERESARRLEGNRADHRVVVVGHSVGAYIGLEVVRRLRAEARERWSEGRFIGGKKGEEVKIVGYVGLWPTVTWIGRSRMGRKIGWLFKLPLFAVLIGLLARLLALCLGKRMLRELLEIVNGMPENAAEVTAEFLASEQGVQQALHMAGDEMREITEDRWDEDIWGAATPSQGQPRPNLVFYFGTNDHWVSDQMRDELIAARGCGNGEEDWKANMFVDDMGIPHSFCIRHSPIVADKTVDWIQDMIKFDSWGRAFYGH